MAARKKRRKKKQIKTIRDIHLEKEKLLVALDYSEKAIEDDWQAVKEKVKPKGFTQWIDNALPLLGQALPISKLAMKIVPSILSRKSSVKENTESGEEENEESDADSPGLGDRLKKGFFKTLAPFLAGTLASASILFRTSRKDKSK